MIFIYHQSNIIFQKNNITILKEKDLPRVDELYPFSHQNNNKSITQPWIESSSCSRWELIQIWLIGKCAERDMLEHSALSRMSSSNPSLMTQMIYEEGKVKRLLRARGHGWLQGNGILWTLQDTHMDSQWLWQHLQDLRRVSQTRPQYWAGEVDTKYHP